MPRRRRVAPDVEHLMELNRLLVGVAYRSLEAARSALPLSQFRALLLLAQRGPMSGRALAEELDVISSTGSRLCDKLVARGWVDRVVRADNRREVQLSVTLAGQRIVDDVLSRRAAELEQVLRRLPPTSRAALAELLPELLDAAGSRTQQPRAAWAV